MKPESSQLLTLAIYEGIIWFQIIYIFLQWSYIRKREYLYYIGYMIAMSLYSLLKYEPMLGISILHNIDPHAEQHFDRALPLFGYFLYYRFIRYFVNMLEDHPKLESIVRKMEYLVLAYVGFELTWEFLGFNRVTGEIIFSAFSAFLFITTVWLGYLILKKRNVLVYFVIAGAIVVNVGAFITLAILFFEPRGYVYNYDELFPVQLSIVIELLLFTTGLAYKSRLDEREKIKAQQELIRQMEHNLVLSGRMNDMRHKIARDLHDEIGSTLSSINLYSDVALSSLQQQPSKTAEVLGSIKKNAVGMMDSMYDILWALNPKTETFMHLTQKMQQLMQEMLVPHQIHILFQGNDALNDLKVHMQAHRNIYLVFKEAINNMAKYSGCTEAEVAIGLHAENILISIRDNGIGFDLEKVTKGNGLFFIQDRVQEIGGKISISTSPGSGCTFNIELNIPNIRG